MFVSTDPAAMTAAAGGLQVIGSTVASGNAAAAAPTMGVIPPAPGADVGAAGRVVCYPRRGVSGRRGCGHGLARVDGGDAGHQLGVVCGH